MTRRRATDQELRAAIKAGHGWLRTDQPRTEGMNRAELEAAYRAMTAAYHVPRIAS
jgi:hypothetical protein